MLKYTGKYWIAISSLLRKPFRQAYGKEFTSRVFKRGKQVYRDMLAKTDDIGADNPMASNIYVSYVPIFCNALPDSAPSRPSQACLGLVHRDVERVEVALYLATANPE